MLKGMIVLWFALTFLSLIYLTFDLFARRARPSIMKMSWFFATLYTGPVAFFLYLMNAREEKLKRSHDPIWRWSLGSLVHGFAGEATGILIAIFLLRLLKLSPAYQMVGAYFFALFFGLGIFQSFFMKKILGANFKEAFKKALFPEVLSTNMLFSGMMPMIWFWTFFNPEANDPFSLSFFGMMSASAAVGSFVCYPINHWLIRHGLKRGMGNVMIGEDKTNVLEPRYERTNLLKKVIILLETYFALLIGILLSLTYTPS